jgi:hypothetical protein
MLNVEVESQRQKGNEERRKYRINAFAEFEIPTTLGQALKVETIG